MRLTSLLSLILALTAFKCTQASKTLTSVSRGVSRADTLRSSPAIDIQNLPETDLLSHPDASKDSLTYRGGDSSSSSSSLSALIERLKIASYFALWYALNVVYNIVNKKVLNVLPAPLTVGTLQFGVGALYASLLWLTKLRTPASLTTEGRPLVAKIGLYHAAGQLLSMVSLGAGPVSFTHIVKALEPFFSAVVNGIMYKNWMKWQVYATLVPVVGGVGYACLKERSFSWLAFNCAMGSNIAFALRAVCSKAAMTSTNIGTNMTSANLFGLVTIAAFWMSIPAALLGEGMSFMDEWNKALETSDVVELSRALIISGLFHYLNNEVMYLALSNVHPVTLAVGNTMKRVFIMVASVLVFRNPVSLQAGIGSAIGIGGVLLYSLTKQYYESLESARADEMLLSSKGKNKGNVKVLASAEKPTRRWGR